MFEILRADPGCKFGMCEGTGICALSATLHDFPDSYTQAAATETYYGCPLKGVIRYQDPKAYDSANALAEEKYMHWWVRLLKRLFGG